MISIAKGDQRLECESTLEAQGIPDLHKALVGLQYQGVDIEVTGLLGRDHLRFTQLFYDGIRGRYKLTIDQGRIDAALRSIGDE